MGPSPGFRDGWPPSASSAPKNPSKASAALERIFRDHLPLGRQIVKFILDGLTKHSMLFDLMLL